MTPGKASERIIGDRLNWVNEMVAGITSLPLGSYEEFCADKRNIWAAESCLRRALEALFDLGRHILAKRFGKGVSEYKEIATELENARVLSQDEARLFRTLAGYRNRLVHFYHDVTQEELYRVCKDDLGDVLTLKEAYTRWVGKNPKIIDKIL